MAVPVAIKKIFWWTKDITLAWAISFSDILGDITAFPGKLLDHALGYESRPIFYPYLGYASLNERPISSITRQIGRFIGGLVGIVIGAALALATCWLAPFFQKTPEQQLAAKIKELARPLHQEFAPVGRALGFTKENISTFADQAAARLAPNAHLIIPVLTRITPIVHFFTQQLQPSAARIANSPEILALADMLRNMNPQQFLDNPDVAIQNIAQVILRRQVENNPFARFANNGNLGQAANNPFAGLFDDNRNGMGQGANLLDILRQLEALENPIPRGHRPNHGNWHGFGFNQNQNAQAAPANRYQFNAGNGHRLDENLNPNANPNDRREARAAAALARVGLHAANQNPNANLAANDNDAPDNLNQMNNNR